MCDYSLHVYSNRLAAEGEELVVHRFGGASLGLASPFDLRPVISASSCCQTANQVKWWSALKEWFIGTQPQSHSDIHTPAVCVPPGARLLLQDIPRALQRELCVAEVEEVRFVEISAQVNTYRDAIRFKNDRQLLLQALREGQRVTVLSLTETRVDERALPELQAAYKAT